MISLADKCVDGITPNRERPGRSVGVVAAFSPRLGDATSAWIVKETAPPAVHGRPG